MGALLCRGAADVAGKSATGNPLQPRKLSLAESREGTPFEHARQTAETAGAVVVSAAPLVRLALILAITAIFGGLRAADHVTPLSMKPDRPRWGVRRTCFRCASLLSDVAADERQ